MKRPKPRNRPSRNPRLIPGKSWLKAVPATIGFRAKLSYMNHEGEWVEMPYRSLAIGSTAIDGTFVPFEVADESGRLRTLDTERN